MPGMRGFGEAGTEGHIPRNGTSTGRLDLAGEIPGDEGQLRRYTGITNLRSSELLESRLRSALSM